MAGVPREVVSQLERDRAVHLPTRLRPDSLATLRWAQLSYRLDAD